MYSKLYSQRIRGHLQIIRKTRNRKVFEHSEEEVSAHNLCVVPLLLLPCFGGEEKKEAYTCVVAVNRWNQRTLGFSSLQKPLQKFLHKLPQSLTIWGRNSEMPIRWNFLFVCCYSSFFLLLLYWQYLESSSSKCSLGVEDNYWSTLH